MQTLLDRTEHADTTLHYQTNAGLARPDHLDRPAEVESKLAELDPDIIVATFAAMTRRC